MSDGIKKITAILLCAVLLCALAACGSSSSSVDPYAGVPESTGGHAIEVKAAADHLFSLNCNMKYSFNPLVATNHSNQLVCSLVYENMLEVDNDFNVIPNIITDWECNDDGTYWTFTVDETNHFFHDGTQVTSKDLRYSFERAINSDRYQGRFASVQGVSWGDGTDGTGKLFIALGIGNKQLIKLMNIPVIQSGSAAEKFPGGSGPYMYNEDNTQLLISPYYTGGKPPVDVIYLKEYGTADTVISAFEDSLIDVVINDPSSYTNLGYASSNEFHAFATTNMHYVAFNEESPVAKIATFRYAMNYAFDRAYLVELLNGNAVDSAIPMYPTCDIYPNALNNELKYDLNTCKTILDNAGIRDYDEDGKLEYMNGSAQDIELTFVLCSDSSAKSGIAHRFADDMEKMGLTVNVYELTWDEYLTALEEGELSVGKNKTVTVDMYYAEVRVRNDFDITELLQVRTEDNERSNLNFMNTRDDSYVSYINAYLGASDVDRADRYLDFCKYLTQNANIIIIGFEKQQLIVHRGIMKGVETNMGNPMCNFVNWEINLNLG